MQERQILATYATRGGKYWLQFWKSDLGYGYSTESGGGSFGALGLHECEAKVARIIADYALDGINLKTVA